MDVMYAHFGAGTRDNVPKEELRNTRFCDIGQRPSHELKDGVSEYAV